MASPQGALFWPRRRALLLADLHLEKASFFARFGQFLPPHDSRATLAGIERLIETTGARELWCLGDSFHDRDGSTRLKGQALELLNRLTGKVRWTWITGNHDPLIGAPGNGAIMAEALVDGIFLRHETEPMDGHPEISGHWHPKLKVRIHGQSLRRQCFVQAPNRLILPAFGALTGGMNADDPVLITAVGRPVEALIPIADRLLRFSLAR